MYKNNEICDICFFRWWLPRQRVVGRVTESDRNIVLVAKPRFNNYSLHSVVFLKKTLYSIFTAWRSQKVNLNFILLNKE